MRSSVLHTSKGSIIAEAAVVFPVFLLAMATILGLITQAYQEAKLYNKLCERASSDITYVLDVDPEVDFLVKLGSTDNGKVFRILYYRPFYGGGSEDEEIVYIFPNKGERYHRKGCSTMERSSDYKEVLLTEAVSEGYTECKLCGEGGTDYFK